MFKPLIPFISDMLAHDFSEAIHVSTVHAVYGSNHVEKEMAAASKEDSKNQNTIKYDSQVTLHLSAATDNAVSFTPKDNKLFSGFRLHTIPTVFIGKHLPPPKFS